MPEPTSPTPADQPQPQPQGGAPAGAPQPTGPDTPTPQQQQPEPVPYARFKEVNDRLQALERDQRKATADAQKAADDAAAEQGKFKELAEQRQARVTELEPQVESLTAERDRLLAIVQAQQAAAIDALPEALRDLAPPAEDIAGRAAFLDKSRKAAEALNGRQPQPGNGGGPRPAGSPNGVPQPALDAAARQLARNF